MIAFLKSLWSDRRGNALVIVAAALPLVLGSAGLASDTIQWTLWKRQLQRGADSAAMAGVYARFQSQAVNSAITTDLAKNNHTWASLVAGYPQVNLLANSATQKNGVQVTLGAQKSLGFSSFFLPNPPTIITTATAAAVEDAEFCVVALDQSGAALTIGGNANAVLGCGAISNSLSDLSVAVNGNSYNFTADPVAGAGGLPTSITGATKLWPGHLAQPDPFASLYSTAVPAGMNCQNFNQKVTTTTTGTGLNRVTSYGLQPGCFSSFNPGNQTYNLEPGVYYLNNTDFLLNGNANLVGTGVTFVLTGTDPGSLQINGTSTLNLTAPTTGDYARMLFIQASNADPANTNTVNGSNASALDGSFYFPTGKVTYTGDNASLTKCIMVVAFQVEFSGSSNIQNNTTGCTGPLTVPGWKVRLIA